MRYAMIQTGGKQYRVAEGDVLDVESLGKAANEAVTFQDVLLYVSKDPDSMLIGKPFLSDVAVKAVVVAEKKGEKIRVAKFKAKARYRRVTGHRQSLSTIKIEKIVAGNEPKKVAVPATEKKESPTVARKPKASKNTA